MISGPASGARGGRGSYALSGYWFGGDSGDFRSFDADFRSIDADFRPLKCAGSSEHLLHFRPFPDRGHSTAVAARPRSSLGCVLTKKWENLGGFIFLKSGFQEITRNQLKELQQTNQSFLLLTNLNRTRAFLTTL